MVLVAFSENRVISELEIAASIVMKTKASGSLLSFVNTKSRVESKVKESGT